MMGLFTSIASLIQLVTGGEMLGRVMSIFMLTFRGGMPLGNLVLAGYLADHFPAPFAILAQSLVLGAAV